MVMDWKVDNTGEGMEKDEDELDEGEEDEEREPRLNELKLWASSQVAIHTLE
jgi:hypothetical protein